ncbi:C-type lectin domain family 19 member A-like [Branchiostoma floridae x Branchiostoma belcheri]
MKDAAKWEKANLHCKRLGANLTSITSRHEANFIKQIITGAPAGEWGVHLVWFGLHRIDGKFRKFTDGSQVTYTNWQKGQPNNKRHFWRKSEAQDCVGLYSKGGLGSAGIAFLLARPQKGQWNDDQCHRPYPFICKRPN